MVKVSDWDLLAREFFNANKFTITFSRDISKDEYVFKSKIYLGEFVYHCAPETWVILPHGFFTPSWSDKGIKPEDVIAHWNFGKDMRCGRKPNREHRRAVT